MKIEHQLKTVTQVLSLYDGKLPLHRFLLSYFKQNKQMGASDRRWANRYLFSFFRLGNILENEKITTRLAIADFLCNQTLSLMITNYLPTWVDKIQLSIGDKISLIQNTYPDFNLSAVFPLHKSLMHDVQNEAFYSSHFIQPHLFIRVLASQIEKIITHLLAQEVWVERLSATTLALPNGTKLEQVLGNGFTYQVQDLSSQQVGTYFEPQPNQYWWDCCTASGGKSLLLHQIEPKIKLLVSDVRENILFNLDERFKAAGIKDYQKKVIDLQQNRFKIGDTQFDGIILDAPCSGSGTWGRSPENLVHFDANKIATFAQLQKNIATNVVPYLKVGKPLVYITCSVFKQENEDVVSHLLNTLALKLQKMELIKGYQHQADTMFVARLIKQ